MGLWRVTRRKQPQPEERRAIYHALGQTEDVARKFPRVVAYVTAVPEAAAAPPVKPNKPRPPGWAQRAGQLERIAEARRLLSPKSKVALAKLKSGQTALTGTDRNAMKHLIAQLKKTGFDVDGFLAAKDTDQDQTPQDGCSQEQKRGP
ncbi:hypothetical protein RCCS2_13099 [Roseobacter sp. CCS2]|nr:hypothetical protein RCCS2_13099 [Roseobacter sp. CCS2]